MDSIEKPYGAWLRAEPKRRTHTIGARWLRNGGNFQAKNSGGNGEGSTDKESSVIDAQDNQDATNVGLDSMTKHNQRRSLVITDGNLSKHIQPIITPSNQSDTDLEDGNNEQINLVLNLVDPKRRRTEQKQQASIVSTQQQDIEMKSQEESSSGSKNDLLAGSAMQARLSL